MSKTVAMAIIYYNLLSIPVYIIVELVCLLSICMLLYNDKLWPKSY